MKRRNKEKIFTSLLTVSIVLAAQSMALTAEGDSIAEEIPEEELFGDEFPEAEIVEEELSIEEEISTAEVLPETNFDLAESSEEEIAINIDAIEVLSGEDAISEQMWSGEMIPEETAQNAVIELTYENDEIIIKATALAEAGLPQGTVLVGEKLAEDSEAYQTAKELSRQKTGAGEQASYSFYRVIFLVDGREIEPEDGTVSIQIEFKNQKTDGNAKIQKVMHIENQQEVNDVTAQTVEGDSISSTDFNI